MTIATGLLSAIHRAAFDSRAWTEVLGQIEVLSGQGRVAISALHADQMSPAPVPTIFGGFDAADVKSYFDHFAGRNPWATKFAAVQTDLVVANDLLSDAELMATEFYNDWAKPQDDLRGGVLLHLRSAGGARVFFACNLPQRARAQGEPLLKRLLGDASAHLRHAIEVGEVLRRQEARFLLNRQDLPEDGASLIVIDPARRLVMVDSFGPSPFVGLCGLDPRGRLRFRRAEDQARLEHLLARGAARGTGVAARWQSPGWEIRAIPVAGEQRLLSGTLQGGGREDLTGIVLSPLAASEGTLGRELAFARRYGLTAAEAAVARELAHGRAAEEIAALRGTSLHTVRNQIKAVLAKCDARRISEVVRLFLAP